MYQLKKNLSKGLAFGVMTFLVPLALGAVAVHYALGMTWLTATLMASMFAAHTLIGYPIVSRFGLAKSPAVIIAVTGAIVTVLGSLMVLASLAYGILFGLFEVQHLLRLFGGLVLYCVFVTVVYPRLTRWFFRQYHDDTLQFIYVLTLVFIAAAIASFIGLEGVFGAFYAGLTLNRYIPSRSSLMGRIEFVGNSIFIPYFLIGVGMLIDVRLVASDVKTIEVAAVMCVVAMAVKWLAAFVAQLSFRLSRIDRSMMYQLSNAHTAVALAVVMIGHKLGVFNEVVLNATVLMILVTCTVSSFGVERAARRLVLRNVESEADSDDGTPQKAHHTLISVAEPHSAKQMVDVARYMQGKQSQYNKLYALHVRSDNAQASRTVGKNSLEEAQKAANATSSRLIPIERYDINIVTGVLNTMAERDIATLHLGLHRRKRIIDTFLGSKIEQLLKSTNAMVVISRIFVPVNTVSRIVVVVPAQAQYEGGFRHWVEAVGNLTREVGCKVVFCGADDTNRTIRSVLERGRFGIHQGYVEINYDDDFVLLPNRIHEDDLLVVVAARRSSVSFSPYMNELPEFLQKYFSSNNLIILYPEHAGTANVIVPTMAETMTADITAPSPIWMFLRRIYRRINPSAAATDRKLKL